MTERILSTNTPKQRARTIQIFTIVGVLLLHIAVIWLMSHSNWTLSAQMSSGSGAAEGGDVGTAESGGGIQIELIEGSDIKPDSTKPSGLKKNSESINSKSITVARNTAEPIELDPLELNKRPIEQTVITEPEPKPDTDTVIAADTDTDSDIDVLTQDKNQSNTADAKQNQNTDPQVDKLELNPIPTLTVNEERTITQTQRHSETNTSSTVHEQNVSNGLTTGHMLNSEQQVKAGGQDNKNGSNKNGNTWIQL